MEEEKKEVLEPNKADDKTSNNEEATEDVAKKLASLEAQKEHFRDKYNKLKEVLENVSFDEEEKKEETPKPNISENDRLDILDFSIQHRELEREDVLKISKYAKSLGISMEQALKDDFIQAGIEKKSKEKASQDASINSTRSPRSNTGKEVKYKAGMSRDEFKNLLKQNGLL